MPVQINEQNQTIYNVTICNLSVDDAHKHVGRFLLLCYTVSENIDRLLLRMNVTSDSSTISIIASAINWFTNIHLFRFIRDRGYRTDSDGDFGRLVLLIVESVLTTAS